MIAAAETLMREQGLAGAAINPVVKLSRAPIGSVYHHFPGGKTQLASEALRIHGEKVRRLLVAAFDTKWAMSALFTSSGYRAISMSLNTYGVQHDEGDERFPVIAGR